MDETDMNKMAQQCMDEIQRKVHSLKKINVVILGKSGVGKSTLINSLFRDNFAETGVGKPITNEIRKIEKRDYPLAIYDTPGLELGEEQQNRVKNDVLELIRKGAVSENQVDAIHCIWYCVNVGGSRFETKEADLIRQLTEETADIKVPVIVILTQASNKKPRKEKGKPEEPTPTEELKKTIEGENLHITKVIPLLAKDDKERSLKAFGLDTLVNVMVQLLPDELQLTFQNIQKASLEAKKRHAQSIITATVTTTFGVGFIPLPFADAAALVPIQVGMIAGITTTFGLDVEKSVIATFISSTIGGVGATVLGKTIVSQLLKLIPGVGAMAGGLIGGVTASILTIALGETYISIMEMVFKNELRQDEILSGKGQEAMKKIFKGHLAKEHGKKFPREITDPVKELIAPAEADFLALVPQVKALGKSGRLGKLGYPEYGRVHGLGHIYRVLLLSLIYYYHANDSLSPADKNVLVYFSLLHDIGRTNDGKDASHGEKALKKIRNKSIEIDGLDLTEEDKAIASFAIRCHCIPDIERKSQILLEMTRECSRDRALKLYRICKDMDGLDRVRLGKRGLDPKQLRTDYAKCMTDAAYIIYHDHMARQLAESQ